MAPIGTIISSIKLHNNNITGPSDVVSGTVTLTYRPNATSSSTTQELFGPLHLHVVLRGIMKLQVAENRTSHAYIWFYETIPLLHRRTQIFDGSFRAKPMEKQSFDFQMLFQTRDDWSGPPSFKTRFDAVAVRQAGKHQGAAAVEYGLQVEADMPGIDIEFTSETSPPLLQYNHTQKLPSGGDFDFSQSLQVQSYSLLPENERPTGLLDKTKAVLTNVARPVYAFTAKCSTAPSFVAPGQSIRIDVGIQVDQKLTTAVITPDIQLGDSFVELVAHTELYATNKKGVVSPRLDNFTTISRSPAVTQVPSSPFSKANEFSKNITFAALPSDVASSFNAGKLKRSYRLKIELNFLVEDQIVGMKKTVAVQVVPKLPSPTEPILPEAGPSRRVAVDEELPSYAEARAT